MTSSDSVDLHDFVFLKFLVIKRQMHRLRQLTGELDHPRLDLQELSGHDCD